jgi:hypothetical protein
MTAVAGAKVGCQSPDRQFLGLAERIERIESPKPLNPPAAPESPALNLTLPEGV